MCWVFWGSLLNVTWDHISPALSIEDPDAERDGLMDVERLLNDRDSVWMKNGI